MGTATAASVEALAACVDIGGTKALLGIVDRDGAIVARDRYLLAPGECAQPEELVSGLVGRLRKVAAEAGIAWSRIAGLGYSTAGMMDVDCGVIFACPTQGEWRDVPFRELLTAAAGVPAWIEMDANAAALGEAWKGAGAGAEYFLYMVVGTGIGSGILVRGEVMRGWRGTAGEIGHTTIDPDGPRCNCGNYGCLEALAAGPAIALRAQGVLLQCRPTLMAELAGDGPLTAETVVRAARRGDGPALEILQATARYIGIGIANALTFISPEVVALGGGVMKGAGDLLLAPIVAEVHRRCGNWVAVGQRRIVLSVLGEEAGLLGAARLVWNGVGC
ncbi:MAG: ROK family protein [Anaerolineae bacterium]